MFGRLQALQRGLQPGSTRILAFQRGLGPRVGGDGGLAGAFHRRRQGIQPFGGFHQAHGQQRVGPGCLDTQAGLVQQGGRGVMRLGQAAMHRLADLAR